MPFTVCLPEQLSTPGRLGWGPSLGPMDHSVGSDWLLDPLGVDQMRMDHPFCSRLSFQYSLPFFLSCCRFLLFNCGPEGHLCFLYFPSNLTRYYVSAGSRETYRNRLTVIRHSQIVKFYYWRPLGLIYCRDNGLAVFSNGWLKFCWWIGNGLIGRMRFP